MSKTHHKKHKQRKTTTKNNIQYNETTIRANENKTKRVNKEKQTKNTTKRKGNKHKNNKNTQPQTKQSKQYKHI